MTSRVADDDPLIADLESSIAPLMLLDPERRTQELEALDEEKRVIADKALQLAAQLYEPTMWTPAQLLERLGCEMSVSQLRDVNVRKLRRCEHFLGLVVRLVQLVDTTRDKRTVVLECRNLLSVTRRYEGGLGEAVKAGPFSAEQYLGLGEISAAGDAVRSAVGSDDDVGNPYAAAPTVHLSGPRISLLLSDREDLLGTGVKQRMTAHIATCDACRDAVDVRRASTLSGYVDC